VNGSVHHYDLVADTGSAVSLILRTDLMNALRITPWRDRQSNFGSLEGGWIQWFNPDLGIVELVVAYGNDRAAVMAARSDPDFVGLIGLPLLRLGEYGGNATEFWFRYPPNTHTP
jgi:hypothetical protein